MDGAGRGRRDEDEDDGLADREEQVEGGQVDGTGSPPEEDDRPEVRITAKLHLVVHQAVGGLAARTKNLYARHGMLVRVEMRDGSPRIAQVPVGSLRLLLSEAVRFSKFSRRDGDYLDTAPPEDINRVIADHGNWPLPELEGVAVAPFLRPDGTVCEAAGYDEASKVLLHLDAPYPSVPPAPTRDEARSALESIQQVFCDFPFVADSDRSAAVAAVLTLLARPAIDAPTPLFAIRAPTPGTGKGKLASAIGTIGTGTPPSPTQMPGTSEELRKKLMALALEGALIAYFDNADGSVGNDVLASALTATTLADRILGRSKMVRLPLKPVWLLTGNNVHFTAAMGRRSLPIDLDAGVEHPEDRKGFRIPDILSHVKQARPSLVTDGLTALRAYINAGRPSHGETPMGSFEAWDDLIRGTIVWGGLADPASEHSGLARGRLREEGDEDLAQLRVLLHALHEAFGPMGFTTAGVTREAAGNPLLRQALDEAAPGKGGDFRAKALGFLFRRFKGRPASGLRLVRDGCSTGNVAAWRIEECAESGGGA